MVFHLPDKPYSSGSGQFVSVTPLSMSHPPALARLVLAMSGDVTLGTPSREEVKLLLLLCPYCRAVLMPSDNQCFPNIRLAGPKSTTDKKIKIK